MAQQQIPIATLTGSTIGAATILFPKEVDGLWMTYTCRCVCGTLFEQSAVRLLRIRERDGKLNCGCGRRRDSPRPLRVSRPQRPQALYRYGWEKSFHHRYSGYKRSAIERGYVWELTPEQFYAASQNVCYYCGKEPAQEHRLRDCEPYVYNGLDRINNECGYILDNVVACCGWCNKAKADHDVAEFIAWAKQIAERFKPETSGDQLQTYGQNHL